MGPTSTPLPLLPPDPGPRVHPPLDLEEPRAGGGLASAGLTVAWNGRHRLRVPHPGFGHVQHEGRAGRLPEPSLPFSTPAVLLGGLLVPGLPARSQSKTQCGLAALFFIEQPATLCRLPVTLVLKGLQLRRLPKGRRRESPPPGYWFALPPAPRSPRWAISRLGVKGAVVTSPARPPFVPVPPPLMGYGGVGWPSGKIAARGQQALLF